MPKFQPKDIIALVTVVGLIVLKVTGNNGDLDVPVALILGYYFAYRKNTWDPGK